MEMGDGLKHENHPSNLASASGWQRILYLFDDPIEFNIEDLNIKKLGNEDDINRIIKSEKIQDVIIALDKPTFLLLSSKTILRQVLYLNCPLLFFHLFPFLNLISILS